MKIKPLGSRKEPGWWLIMGLRIRFLFEDFRELAPITFEEEGQTQETTNHEL
jgi:hypothetical protein